MKSKGAIGKIVFIVVVLVIGVIIGLKKSNFGKSRETETSLLNKNINEESEHSKIVEKGLDMTIEIGPAINNTISGIVNVSVTSFPENTQHVGFMVVKKIEDIGTNETSLGIDSDGSNGWTRIIDTTDYENGLYFVVAIASTEIGAPPTGSANIQVEIKN